ncbi:hypothetical protein HUG15_10050 [Salicibibacter cibarius]|uniref:Uncharacterized protein n=1 Tax=Salicibibacter cibarius TaxID=2743000 RepID=A0A7T6YZM0_9BACI|nr:hypothetical protein [Salicibibacter cibarius]QQK74154.1 hypothetical protein HUG15_10050 [Salicibibacter cibarius]
MSPVSKHRKKKQKKKKKPPTNQHPKTVNFVCLQCHEHEAIPYTVVRDFDHMDPGDPSVPPMFACQQCEGEMYPEYYKGVHGYEYRLSDKQ